MLDETAPALVEATGRRIIAVSPPGWETPPLAPTDYRPTALARLVVDLLDTLELERATYAGFSWGASIGCHLAATSPERLDALVLLDAGYTDFQDRPGFEELDLEAVLARAAEEAQEARWPSWDACFAFFRPRVRAWRPALEERVRAGMREEDGEIVPIVGYEPFAAAAYGVMVEPPSATLEQLGKLKPAILLVVATDTVATEHGRRALERFRSAVPHADVEEIDSGHDLLSDAPEETVAVVGNWIQRSVA
jgi:pimeloyl-ACP methyl ester carboxylesterase